MSTKTDFARSVTRVRSKELRLATCVVAVTLAPIGLHPGKGYGPARRAEDARSWLEAVKILQREATLRADASRSISAHSLGVGQKQMLLAFGNQFEEALVDLAVSQRPDAGYAFLVGLARLLAIEASLGNGHLVVLDVFPADVVRFSAKDIAARGGGIDDLAEESRAEFINVLDVLSRRERLREADYAAL